MISKARRYLNWKSLLTLYYSFIYTYLTYCNHVWGSTYVTNLEKLFVLQKKALRIMCSKPKRSSTDPLFYELGILRFHDINLYLMGKFMFRFYKSEVPELFVNYFNSNAETHDYFTRQHNHLHVPMIKSNLSKFAIRYRRVIIWNGIMKLGIDPDTSEAVFVKLFKKCILTQKIRLWYKSCSCLFDLFTLN